MPFRWISKTGIYDPKDKDNNISRYINYMLCRTQSMFHYTGLPETIPARMLELYLQTSGCVAITRVNGELYAFTGGLGGEPDVYYQDTIFTVANPALNYSNNLKIGKDCALVDSDSLRIGLLPLFGRYASAMVENDITMYIADINSRIVSLLSAPDERTRSAAEEYIRKIIKGDLSVIAETALLDGIRAQPYGSSGTSNQITQLIELQQYLKASWYNEIGLNANYNMKREAINSNESQLNEAALLPLVDDMLRSRQRCFDDVNKMYGTDIHVELYSSWGDLKDATSLDPENDEYEELSARAESDEPPASSENEDGGEENDT